MRVRAADRVPPQHLRDLEVARVRELAGHLGDRVLPVHRRLRVAATEGARGALIARPPAAPRRGSSAYPCSGRGCRRAPRGSRRPLGSGLRRRRSAAATTSPGVQKPHCTAPVSTNASCTRCSRPVLGEPLHGDDLVPVRLGGEHEARAHEPPVEEHRARAALALLARVLRARDAQPVAERGEQALAGPDVRLARLPVDHERDPHARHLSSARLARTRSA